jgi:hypothetical protein
MEQENKMNIQGDFSDLSLSEYFKKDSYHLYVYKKTERLVTVIYMLTNLFLDKEPIKWHLRDEALDLLSNSLSFSSRETTGETNAVKSFVSGLIEISSILEFAKISGLVSEMNCRLIRSEFDALLRIIEKNEDMSLISGELTLPNDFFDLPENISPNKSSFGETEVNRNMGTKISKGQSQFTPAKGVSFKPVVAKKEVTHSTANQIVKPMIQVATSVKVPGINRSEAILDMLKKDNNLTIKDFANVITDCSEKTIQRELLAMVGKGMLKKEGERRWSRYSLA